MSEKVMNRVTSRAIEERDRAVRYRDEWRNLAFRAAGIISPLQIADDVTFIEQRIEAASRDAWFRDLGELVERERAEHSEAITERIRGDVADQREERRQAALDPRPKL